MNHIPEHNYSSYKKHNSLDYFTGLTRKNKKQDKSTNPVYKSMKNYSLIYKLFQNFNKNKDKQKTKRRSVTQAGVKKHSYSMQYGSPTKSEMPQIKKQQIFNPLNLFTNLPFIKSQPELLMQTQTVMKKQKKSKTIDVRYTSQKISSIKGNADRMHLNLSSNKKQYRIITKYNRKFDKYLDQLPSPTQSVSRQSMRQHQKLKQFCQQDVFKQRKKKQKKQKQSQLQTYLQPDVPQTIKQQLIQQNKMQIRQKKFLKQQKLNKVQLKQTFLKRFNKDKYNTILSKQTINETIQQTRRIVIPNIIKRRNRLYLKQSIQQDEEIL